MKLRHVALVVMMLVSLLVVACAQPAPAPAPMPAPAPSPAPAPAPSPAPAPAPSPAPTQTLIPGVASDWPPPGAKPMAEIVAAAKSAGGTSGAINAGFVNLYNRYAKDSRMTVEVLGGQTNIAKNLRERTANLLQGSNTMADFMYSGRVSGEEGVKTRLRWLWGGGSAGLTIAGVHVKANSGIKTFADLKGKKVGAQTPAAPWVETNTASFRGPGSVASTTRVFLMPVEITLPRAW